MARAKAYKGLRKRSVFYAGPDQHEYHKCNVMNGGRVSLRCVFMKSKSCRGRASMRADMTAFRVTQRHNHGPFHGFVTLRNFRRFVLRRCRRRDNTSFKLIYSQERNRLRIPPEVAALLPLEKLKHSMLRARLESFPPLPRTLDALQEILENPAHADITETRDQRDNIYGGAAGSEADGTKCVIFISGRFQRYLQDVKKVFSDGTFDPVPACLQNCIQVWNVSTTWRREEDSTNHTVPLFRVLMQSKSKEAYDAALEGIKRLAPQFRPTKLMSDFELAQIVSWQEQFPHLRNRGCIFHYAKKVGWKARKLGLAPIINDNPEVDTLVRSLCAIPLLKTTLLKYGLKAVTDRALQSPHYHHLRPLLVYVKRYWIKERKEVLSVYKSEDRTSNVAESDNNQLRIAVHHKHPNLWTFIDGLKDMEDTAWLNLNVLRGGGAPTRKRSVEAIANDRVVKNLTADVDAGRISIFRFLRLSSFRLENVYLQGINGER